jgi:DNA-binding beta-propeller fold protein YncE
VACCSLPKWGKIVLSILLLAGAVLLLRKPMKRAFWDKAKTVSTGRFQDPEGIALDPEGNLFVADEDKSVLFMLDKDGRIVAQAATLPGIERVTGGDSLVVLGPRHVVAIGDHCLLELKVVDGKFELVRQISRRGHGEGEFEDPEGISLDRATGEIYATDEDHRRVLVFDQEGKYLRKIAVEADPESVCVFEDRVYVTMSKAGWVGCYGRDGALRFKFGSDHLREPDCAAVSPDRKLYVTDQRANRIQVFDLDGKFLFTVGKAGTGPGEFDQPEDLAFDADGNLWVADGDNHRIQVLTRDGKFIRLIE